MSAWLTKLAGGHQRWPLPGITGQFRHYSLAVPAYSEGVICLFLPPLLVTRLVQ